MTASGMPSRMNQWFVPGDGIAREVITADIQRYLGPDALVRPGPGNGEYEGRPGYWITAYRTLTSQMILDLRSDSQRWQAEKDSSRRGVAYQDSTVHASRQYHGPSSEAYASAAAPKPAYTNTQYETSHYTTAPSTYASSHAYQSSQHPAHTQPRTDPTPYYGAPYGNSPAPNYTYPQPPVQDPYRQPAPQYQHAAPSVVAAPGYYIASDGRQYPISQQPQPQPPPAGRRRNQ